jgi:hypothetical protein
MKRNEWLERQKGTVGGHGRRLVGGRVCGRGAPVHVQDVEVAAQLVFVAAIVARRLPRSWVARATAACVLALIGTGDWMQHGSWTGLAQLALFTVVAIVELAIATTRAEGTVPAGTVAPTGTAVEPTA